jgi:DNA mismatch repair ATPase MutS
MIANMVLHYANKKYIYRYSDSIPQISLLSAGCRELLKMNLPLERPEPVASAVKSIDKIKKRLSVFTLESKQQSDVFMQLAFFIGEYVKIAFLLEPIIVFGVLKHLREKRSDIRNLFEFIGSVDSAVSIASLRHDLERYCKPNMDRNKEGMSFVDMYHPLIPNCVANTLTVQNKSILLTGSNMSGKSTFIRSVTINALFGQTINTCFASDFQLSPMKICSAMRISDDVFSGKSYYFEEVLLIGEMIKESRSGTKTLFLLDEIFKGTNTIERIAAGKAVLSYICKQGNIVFVSTHDIELAGLLKNTYELHHFTEMVEDGRVQFDYKLKSGELKTRNAIRILEINGYPEEIIAEAKEISNRIIQISTTPVSDGKA